MVPGPHRGVVTRVDGSRVRLRVPGVLGNAETPWADPLFEGGEAPTVDQTVWVQFEAGDASRPVWVPNVPPTV